MAKYLIEFVILCLGQFENLLNFMIDGESWRQIGREFRSWKMGNDKGNIFVVCPFDKIHRYF
jgi:tRNA(Glu) U13 pseudouridine synthase TruD